MAIHLYKDAELTQQISEGTLTNPDSDVFNGTDGESKDRQLYLANEQTTLASAINDTTTTVQLAEARSSIYPHLLYSTRKKMTAPNCRSLLQGLHFLKFTLNYVDE